ncbi:glycine betaine ABC transporter substrate-binding protein [Metabacillus lacus]|nr:glycine betaine ABC transporter substrate-binding protein [Metabacillus lacus]
MKKPFFILSLILTLFLAACGNGNNNEGSGEGEEQNKKVSMAMMSWIDNISTAYLWKEILEQEGYEVEMLELDKAAMWTGLSRGDIDLSSQAWLPLSDQSLYQEYQDTIDFGETWYEGTKLGLVVPEYMTDMNSIEDLSAQADTFNSEIVGIDPGSSLMELTSQTIERYGLTNLNLVESSEAAMLTELKKAYDAEQPVVVTLWNPHWIFAEMDLKYLEDPENTYGDPDNIQFMARQGFSEDHPEVYEWMTNWEMNDDQLGSLIKEVENASSHQEGAQQWVENNRELVDGWLNK